MAQRSASQITFQNWNQAQQWLESNGFNTQSVAAQVGNVQSAVANSAFQQNQINYSRQSRSVAPSASVYARSATVAAANVSSNVEQALRNAQTPIAFPNAREQVQAAQYRGLHLNKDEEQQFNGPLPLAQYKINNDSNPELIKKRLAPIRYQQEVAVRHLRPPTPPAPGPLIIREVKGQVPPAPPVVLRQEGQRAQTPCPVVYREQPPKAPTPIPEQTVEVEGKPVPPPARKIVFERLPNQPQKPQNILIEKWLPYKPQARRVVFQRAQVCPQPNPKNLLIEWEQPEVEVEQVCKNLGIVQADPEEYVRRFGSDLKQSNQIPQLCQEPACQQRAPTPLPPTPQCGCVQQRLPTPQPAPCGCNQTQSSSNVPELEGDVAALRLVDLDRYGLSHYKKYVL